MVKELCWSRRIDGTHSHSYQVLVMTTKHSCKSFISIARNIDAPLRTNGERCAMLVDYIFVAGWKIKQMIQPLVAIYVSAIISNMVGDQLPLHNIYK